MLQILAVFAAVALFIAALPACSTQKGIHTKGITKPSAADSTLVGKEMTEVTRQLGEPTTVAKTPEDHILWVYEPRWKVMPDHKGTVYVEFVEGKVVKVFKIK